ncbi:hypothetical protein AN1V17_48590 [Vallitalea sediminicola]
MKFLSMEHKKRVLNLLQRENTYPRDVERLALFYIIAGNTDVHRKVNNIYNFEHHQIKPDCLYDCRVDFCNSSRALVKLAYNLFNGYQDKNVSPFDLLLDLDMGNFHLAT